MHSKVLGNGLREGNRLQSFQNGHLRKTQVDNRLWSTCRRAFGSFRRSVFKYIGPRMQRRPSSSQGRQTRFLAQIPRSKPRRRFGGRFSATLPPSPCLVEPGRSVLSTRQLRRTVRNSSSSSCFFSFHFVGVLGPSLCGFSHMLDKLGTALWTSWMMSPGFQMCCT